MRLDEITSGLREQPAGGVRNRGPNGGGGISNVVVELRRIGQENGVVVRALAAMTMGLAPRNCVVRESSPVSLANGCLVAEVVARWLRSGTKSRRESCKVEGRRLEAGVWSTDQWRRIKI